MIRDSSTLPFHYLITPEPHLDTQDFIKKLESLLVKGIQLVQFRAKRLSAEKFFDLANSVIHLCRQYRVDAIVNCAPQVATGLDAEGVHLTSSRLMSLDQRPLGCDKWVSASCHNAKEIFHACHIGVDFIVISPVLSTESHPHMPTLGWQLFNELAEKATVPAYALGGMTPQHCDLARQHHGHGIAAISAFWNHADSMEKLLPKLAIVNSRS